MNREEFNALLKVALALAEELKEKCIHLCDHVYEEPAKRETEELLKRLTDGNQTNN